MNTLYYNNVVAKFQAGNNGYKIFDFAPRRPGISYAQASRIIMCDHNPAPQPQRPTSKALLPSYNIPAPTRQQWREIKLWRQQHGWRYSKFMDYVRETAREGYTRVGTRKSARKLWDTVHHPTKEIKLICSNYVSKPAVPTSTRQHKKPRIIKEIDYNILDKYFVHPPILIRNKLLLIKLKNKILHLKLRRLGPDKGKIYLKKLVYNRGKCRGEGQMPSNEDPIPGESGVTKVGDTTYVTHEVPEVAMEAPHNIRPALLSTSDPPSRITKVTQRGFVMDTFSWGKTKNRDEHLKTYDLPQDYVNKAKNSPQWMNVLSHAYFRPEFITLEFIVNSSRFSVGQLQASVYYDGYLDNAVNLRKNVYNASQLLHCIIDAGSSAPVILRIPYKHYNPWLRNDTTNLPNMITVTVTVLSPYKTPDNCANTANVSVRCTLENLEFIGLRASDLTSVTGQMMPMLATVASSYLNNYLADRNRDKPPMQQNGTCIEPRATGSLAVGTNIVENLHALRLDGKSQVPHLVQGDVPFDIRIIAQKYSLVKIVSWTKNQGVGTLLFNCDAGPLWDPKNYVKYDLQRDDKTTLESYAIPPVGILASCFNVFSGGIKLRFDIVGSFAHTGSIIVCFIPGYCSDTDPGFEKAKSSYHMTYDIHTDRSFEFKVPYVADKPWWPVLKLDSDDPERIGCYGSVWVYALNPLLCMDNIPSEVEVLIYVAGADDINFAVPVQPQLALPWYVESIKPPKTHEVHARPGYSPYYPGAWRYLLGGNRGAVLRYGPVSDHIAQFDDLRQGNETTKVWYYYTSPDPKLKLITNSQATPFPNTEIALVPLDVNDGYGLIYLVVVPQAFLPFIFIGQYKKNAQPAWDKITFKVQDSDEPYGDGDPILTRVEYTTQKKSYRIQTGSSYEDLTGEGEAGDNRDSASGVVSPVSAIPSSLSQVTFGEIFTDIKTLCRRYELVTIVEISLDQRIPFQNDCRFFALPQGNNFNKSQLMPKVIGRDGLQAVLMACARHFVGSINYKLICNLQTGSVWVQHKPDVSFSFDDIRRVGPRINDVTYLNGYGSAITVNSVNSTLTFNVPYYNPNSLLLLQQPRSDSVLEARRAMSLGEITFGLNHPQLKNVKSNISLYKSLGDDASLHTYVGWPLMVPQYLFKENVTTAGEGQIAVSVKLNDQQVHDMGVMIDSALSKAFDGVFSHVRDISAKYSAIGFLLLTAIPSKNVFSWCSACIGICCQLGLMDTSSMSKVSTSVSECFSSSKSQHSSSNIAPGGEAQGPEDESKYVNTITLLWQALAVGLGFKNRVKKPGPENLSEHVGTLMRLTKDQAVATRGFLHFFQNFFTVVKSLVGDIVAWFHPELKTISALQHSTIMVQEFVKECMAIQNLLIQNTDIDQNLANRIESCSFVGDQIVAIAISTPGAFPPQHWSIIQKQLKFITDTRTTMMKKGISSMSRYTPYCLWMFGEPGVGKSVATTSLASIIIEEMNIKSKNPIFTKPATSKYFTNLTPEQQIYVFDDFGQFCHSDPEISDPAVLIHLKSCAPFNPPMAAVEDKPLLVAPKAIVCLSNTGWPTSNTIVDINALYRRRDLLVEVIKQREPDKMVEGAPLNFNHLRFKIHDRFTKRDMNPSMSYEEFCVYLRQSIRDYDMAEKLLCDNRIRALSRNVHHQNEISPVNLVINNKLECILDHLNSEWLELQKHSGSVYLKNSLARIKEIFKVKKLVKQTTGEELFEDVVSLMAETKPEEQVIPDGVSALDHASALVAERYKDLPTTSTDNSADLFGEGQMPVVPSAPVETGIEVTQDDGIIWHGHRYDKYICEHSRKEFLESTLVGKELVYYDPNGTGNVKYRFSLSKCKDQCVAKASWFHLELHSSSHSLFICNLVQSKMLVENHLMVRPNSVLTWDTYLRTWGKKIVLAFSQSAKFFLKVLKIVLYVAIPSILAIGAIWGAVTGISAAGKYFSKENTSEEGAHVQDYTSCFYDEWSRQWENDKVAWDQAAAQAEYIRHLNAELRQKGSGENNPYEIRMPQTATHSKIVPAKRMGNGQIGQARDISHLISANTIWLTVTGTNKLTHNITSSTVRAFAICTRYVMIPRHYLQEWDKMTGRTVTIFTRGQQSVECSYESINVIAYMYRELCLLHIPKMHPKKDIRSHFLDVNNWNKPRNVNVTITEVDMQYNRTVHNSPSKIYQNFQLTYDGVKLAVLPDVIRYNVQGKGKCMCVVQDHRGFIIGFHIAGDGKFGYAEPVVKETFDDLLDGGVTGMQAPDEVITGIGEISEIRKQITTSVDVVGKLPSRYTRYETGKTAIVPSLIYGVFEPTTMPVPLKPCAMNNFTDPLVEGCKKHGLPDLGFDFRTVKLVEQKLTEKLIQIAKPVFDKTRVWSIEESINGLPDTPSFGRLVMKTSEGFPYVFERPPNAVGKEWLLNPYETVDGWKYNLHPMLDKIMTQKQQMREQGIVPFTPFIDCLKDERLKIAKCYIPGKARIFSVAPLDYLIQYRQYFADFTISFIKNSENLHHSIGIAAERMDWTNLTRNLQSKGDKILCGDYKNFGPAFSIEMHLAANRAKNAWYEYYGATKQDQVVRSCFAYEIENAYHMAGDNLYRVICGHPSGSPDTTEKNSLVNILLITYVWTKIWEPIDPQMATLDRMSKHVWFTTYGDDFIANVSDEAIVHFNNINIQNVFAQCGVEYTDDQKGDTIRPYCLLHEATFLKRHFIPHPTRRGVVCGALDKAKQTDIANWIRNCEDDVEATREVATQCLLLSFGWGKQYFDEVRTALLRAWAERNFHIPLELRTWEEVDNIFYGTINDFPNTPNYNVQLLE